MENERTNEGKKTFLIFNLSFVMENEREREGGIRRLPPRGERKLFH